MSQILSVRFVIPLQSVGRAPLGVRIRYDSANWTLHSKRSVLVPVDAATVELYDPESTPQDPVLSSTAQAELDEAVVKLLTQGIPFFTVFRKDWDAPVIHWYGAKSA